MKNVFVAAALLFVSNSAFSSTLECFNKTQPASGVDVIVLTEQGLMHSVNGVDTVYSKNVNADSTDPQGTTPANMTPHRLTLLAVDNGTVRALLLLSNQFQGQVGNFQKDGTYTETDMKTSIAQTIDVHCFLND
jgi:hypothetical protein